MCCTVIMAAAAVESPFLYFLPKARTRKRGGVSPGISGLVSLDPYASKANIGFKRKVITDYDMEEEDIGEEDWVKEQKNFAEFLVAKEQAREKLKSYGSSRHGKKKNEPEDDEDDDDGDVRMEDVDDRVSRKYTSKGVVYKVKDRRKDDSEEEEGGIREGEQFNEMEYIRRNLNRQRRKKMASKILGVSRAKRMAEKRQTAHAVGRKIAYRHWLFRAYCIYQENIMCSNLMANKLKTDRDTVSSNSEEEFKIEISGEDRFRMMIHVLYNGLVWRIQCFQIKFAKHMIQSLAELVIGDDWATIGPRIMKEFGWIATPKISAACAPRRSGKSIVLSCVQTAFGLTNDNKWQATVASCERQTSNVRTEVCNTIENSGYTAVFVTKARMTESILIRTLFKGDLPCRLSYFPANEKISICLNLVLVLVWVFVFIL